jgi:hypothetical protein
MSSRKGLLAVSLPSTNGLFEGNPFGYSSGPFRDVASKASSHFTGTSRKQSDEATNLERGLYDFADSALGQRDSGGNIPKTHVYRVNVSPAIIGFFVFSCFSVARANLIQQFQHLSRSHHTLQLPMSRLIQA